MGPIIIIAGGRINLRREGGKGKRKEEGTDLKLEAGRRKRRGIAVTTHERKFRSRREEGERTKEGSKEWRTKNNGAAAAG